MKGTGGERTGEEEGRRRRRWRGGSEARGGRRKGRREGRGNLAPRSFLKVGAYVYLWVMLSPILCVCEV